MGEIAPRLPKDNPKRTVTLNQVDGKVEITAENVSLKTIQLCVVNMRDVAYSTCTFQICNNEEHYYNKSVTLQKTQEL